MNYAYLMLGLAALVGIGGTAWLWSIRKEFDISCSGDCNQGRNCDCGDKK